MEHRGRFRSAKWVPMMVLALFLAVGCSSSDDGPEVREGVFVDSPVAGLGYETPIRSGTTDENGRFFYEDGEIVHFFLGGLRLGEAPGRPRLSPLDLVDGAEGVEEPAVTNMSRLLLSLDADCDPNNGIDIPAAVRVLFGPEGPVDPEALDFSLEPEEFGRTPAVLALFAALDETGAFSCVPGLWDVHSARAHLRASLGLDEPRYSLTVDVEGEGTVDRKPAEDETFAEGTEIVLTARPAEEWTFVGWRGDSDGDSEVLTLTMDADRTVVAVFREIEAVAFRLEIGVEGEGTVISDPPGDVHDAGTAVILTAVAAEGWEFAGWSGALTGASVAETLVMDADRQVSARFVPREEPPPRYSLSTAVEGQGAVEVDPASDDGFHELGTRVALSAVPESGWTFVGWEGAADGDVSPISLEMDGDKTVLARFAEIPSPVEYALEIAVNGNGAVDASPSRDGYPEGAEVMLTANPDPGWSFAGWGGDLSGTSRERTLVMDGDKRVTATFFVPISPPPPTPDPPPQPTRYTLAVNIEGEGTVTPDDGVHNAGTVLNLTAVPAEGWEFQGWTGDIGDADPAGNPIALTMDGDRTVSATFEEIPVETYALTATPSGEGTIALDPLGGTYETDTEVTLTAEPGEGWRFVEWTSDIGTADPAGNPIALTMDADRTVAAVFEELTLTLAGRVAARGFPVASATVRAGSAETRTDEAGNYTLALSPAERLNIDGTVPGGPVFAISAAAPGHATTHAKVAYVPGQEDYQAHIRLIPVTLAIGDDDDVTNRVDIARNGETIGELTIPASAFPADVTEIKGNITYIDPTTEDIDAFPGGDFLAVRAGDPDDFDILESLGLMDFDLVDENGTPVGELGGEATVCMKIPGTLNVSDGEEIPLWWYDPDAGLWREEGRGTVEERADGAFWVCGAVSHFTWWNYDRPIETHACFKFSFVKEADGTPVTGLNWFAEGVDYAGTSPERPCGCDAGDPAPCPAAAISSFTVMRGAQIRVYALIDDNTRYYLRDDGDGTFSLGTEVGDATIWTAPDVQGSCLWGENTGSCAFLDGPNGDGILPLGGINYAPTILSFAISDPDGNGQVDADETVVLTAEIVDAEGDSIDASWEIDCPGGTLANEVRDGDFFRVDFAAPSNLAICRVTISATDDHGNRSGAVETIRVFGEPDHGRIAGKVHGPDGNPAAQVPVRLSRPADPDGNWDASDRVFYTRVDGSYEFDEVPCDQEVSDGTGTGLGFSGALAATVPVNGTVWTLEDYATYRCENFDADGCRFDLHFPTRWGTLQGNAYGYAEDTVTFSGGGGGEGTDQEGGGSLRATVAVVAGTYGPLSVPVGTVFVADPNRNPWEWTGFPVLRDGETVVADIGPEATGAFEGTVYDDAGNPVPNAVVRFWQQGAERNTAADAAGKYRFEDVPTGIHDLQGQGTALNFVSGGVALFMRDQTPAPVADINGTGVTVEVILYEYDGNPMADTEVSLSIGRSNETRTTDAAGRCTFAGVNTGMAQVSVWLGETENYRGTSRSFAAGESGSAVIVELQMPAPVSECRGFR
jgi:hypothetical protein